MGDFDPFTTKVGDVYDAYGRRVGSVRSTKVPDATVDSIVWALIIGVPILVIAGIIFLATAGVTSIKNAFLHGEATTDTQGAEFRERLREDPTWFPSEWAKLSIVNPRYRVATLPDAVGTTYAQVTFSIRNAGSSSHKVRISPAVVRATTGYYQTPQNMKLECGWNDNGFLNGFEIDVPAGGTTGLIEHASCDTNYRYSGTVEQLKPPAIEAMDGLGRDGAPITDP